MTRFGLKAKMTTANILDKATFIGTTISLFLRVQEKSSVYKKWYYIYFTVLLSLSFMFQVAGLIVDLILLIFVQRPIVYNRNSAEGQRLRNRRQNQPEFGPSTSSGKSGKCRCIAKKTAVCRALNVVAVVISAVILVLDVAGVAVEFSMRNSKLASNNGTLAIAEL